jgi:3' terminal RNA ribose 2'-O-methyltransferase Hen1
MLLTITTTCSPATDLGYLLAKNPARTHEFSLAFGKAHVFYPEATATRCTAALLLDVDSVSLTRRPGREDETPLAPYVNDRSYVASSFMSVAIAQVFGSALNGKSRDRQQLADEAIPLEAELHVVPCRGGERFLRSLFEPLGYEIDAKRHALDETFPSWGESRYFTVGIKKVCRLRDLLMHLYVLVPVLDDEKHYWVGNDEIEKLLKNGEGWLKDHPEREQIAHRYLRRQRYLTNEAMRRLIGTDEPEIEEAEEKNAREEEALEKKISLNEQRLDTVVATLKAEGASRVIDLGCGEGKLLRLLMKEKSFSRVVGTDVSTRALEIAAERLRLDEMPPKQRARLELFQSSLTYRDARFSDFDAACSVEVIEHLDPSRLQAFERVVFEFSGVPTIVVTTPNAEFNATFENLPAGQFRHKDHRFEWTRAEFEAWATDVGKRHGYEVRFAPIGTADKKLGPPTQMAVFSKSQDIAAKRPSVRATESGEPDAAAVPPTDAVEAEESA